MLWFDLVYHLLLRALVLTCVVEAMSRSAR